MITFTPEIFNGGRPRRAAACAPASAAGRAARPAAAVTACNTSRRFMMGFNIHHARDNGRQHSVARRIESHLIPGPAGKLEAVLEEPEQGEPREAVLVCHPHPQHGGTMHNKVVYRIARGLRRTGCVVLRFNYRGVNLSEGEYGQGIGETEDGRASLAWLRERYPDLPYSLAGFSFGSRVILRLGCALSDVRRLIAVGFPTRHTDRTYVETCTREKIFIQSTNDEHGPQSELETLFATLPEPKRLIWVPAQDHFFAGALDDLENAVVNLS
jgi:alpha/beta superfamily hydrolase